MVQGMESNKIKGKGNLGKLKKIGRLERLGERGRCKNRLPKQPVVMNKTS